MREDTVRLPPNTLGFLALRDLYPTLARGQLSNYLQRMATIEALLSRFLG